MIVDLHKFLESERRYWNELESLLDRMDNDPGYAMDLAQVRHFHYLYERTSADLGKIVTFTAEPEVRRYLEGLVARAYGEIHETREKPHRLTPWHWFWVTFPTAFRRHVRAFWLSVVITLVGCAFGGFAVAYDPSSKAVILPFGHLLGSPSERVAKEEKAVNDRLQGGKSTFSTQLMTHNTQVSIFTLALGITWAVGTIIMLFYNGVILGAVCVDYILDGQIKFLVGWLLPHGSFEIPAILIAGQAGLILGGALIGWGKPTTLRTRFRMISRDLVTLISGVGVMLIWAGFIEAFLSQYHEPVIPYVVKILFGVTELVLLVVFLSRAGRKAKEGTRDR